MKLLSVYHSMHHFSTIFSDFAKKQTTEKYKYRPAENPLYANGADCDKIILKTDENKTNCVLFS